LHIFKIIKIDFDNENVILSKRKMPAKKVINCLKFFFIYKKLESLYNSMIRIQTLNTHLVNFLIDIKKIYKKEFKGLIEFVNNPKKFKKKFFKIYDIKEKLPSKIFYYKIRNLLFDKFVKFYFPQVINFKFFSYYPKGLSDIEKFVKILLDNYLKPVNISKYKLVYGNLKIINYTPVASLRMFYVFITQIIHTFLYNKLIINCKNYL